MGFYDCISRFFNIYGIEYELYQNVMLEEITKDVDTTTIKKMLPHIKKIQKNI